MRSSEKSSELISSKHETCIKIDLFFQPTTKIFRSPIPSESRRQLLGTSETSINWSRKFIGLVSPSPIQPETDPFSNRAWTARGFSAAEVSWAFSVRSVGVLQLIPDRGSIIRPPESSIPFLVRRKSGSYLTNIQRAAFWYYNVFRRLSPGAIQIIRDTFLAYFRSPLPLGVTWQFSLYRIHNSKIEEKMTRDILLAQMLLVKCWWNWLLVSISSTLYYEFFVWTSFFYVHVTRKSCRNVTFVQKNCTFNVDEIDYRTKSCRM